MEDNNIIEKIRKLLALAERGGTEAEAAAAMEKVQALLTKHNLDIDSVRKPEESSFTREFQEFEWNASWIRPIAGAVAKLYFCSMYYTQQGLDKQIIYMVGEKVNILTAQYVVDLVVATGKRLAKAYAQECYRDWGMNPVSASNSFKKGFALRISSRCAELMREAKRGNIKDVETGTALVVTNFYERNETAIAKFIKQDSWAKVLQINFAV